jgi:hypothetical protein
VNETDALFRRGRERDRKRTIEITVAAAQACLNVEADGL